MRRTKKILSIIINAASGLFLCLSAVFVVSCKTVPPAPAVQPAGRFTEIWGYLLSGQESLLNPDLPISDAAYFSAGVNYDGTLGTVPQRTNLTAFSGRVHLVTTCDSKSLTHFILIPGSPTRNSLIKELTEAAADFDGLQIDYELVQPNDRAAFLSFLTELKQNLPDKILSVALPARMKTISNDMYSYETIAPLVDRIIVMAYDEHWSGSTPGAIASMDWCSKVAQYAHSVIPDSKLIMGIPFYGRTWGDDTTANRAWLYTGTERIIRENHVTSINRTEGGIPSYTFTKKQTITGWFEDAHSLSNHCRQYQALDIQSVAFWRIGQEDPAFWQYISLK